VKNFTLNEKGVILILTFIIMTTLCAVTVAFLYMTSVQTKGTGYDITSAKAFWIAEAGLQQVMYKLKNDSNFYSNPAIVNGNLGDGSYSVTVTASSGNFNVASVGTVGVLSRKISCLVTGGGSIFFYSGFGKSSVIIGTQTYTDSYDSSLSRYNVGGNKGHKGNIGSNSNISVSGNAYIDGDASTGPSGTFNVQSVVYGQITHTNNVTLPAVTVPATLTGLTSAGTVNTTRTINPGNYKFSAISLGGSNVATIVGPANIYLTASTAISLSSSAKIVVSASSTGPVAIYTAGTSTIGGSGVVNSTYLPKNFQLYGSTSSTVSITSAAEFYGVVYAPSASISSTGSGALYGSFIANSISFTGKNMIHYDTALSSLAVGSASSGPISMQSWHEIVPAI
jgi:Tfp pilus assembly protein PilX